jgi:TrmH family RNA methyltransferase
VPETLVFRAGAADTGIARDLVAWAGAQDAELLEVSASVLEKLAAKENPQTLLAVYRQRWSDPPQPKALKPDHTWLALEEIRDPGNLGTILRTAEATGVSGILLAGTCCDPWSREAVRATMGSIFNVPLARIDREALVALMSAWPGDTIGTHLDATEDFRRTAYRGPTLLAMGSEGPGLSDAVTAACKRRVKIPMAGRLDSLNLAVATALVLYQLRGRHLRL